MNIARNVPQPLCRRKVEQSNGVVIVACHVHALPGVSLWPLRMAGRTTETGFISLSDWIGISTFIGVGARREHTHRRLAPSQTR